jgi:hypothetical protein
MRDAMGDFADNWTTHRDRLRGDIEELRQARCKCGVTAKPANVHQVSSPWPVTK